MSGKEVELIKDAFDSNWIAPLGPQVDAFEQELAEYLGADTDVMQGSLDRWNALCRKRKDDDFGRPPGTMAVIKNPPYYVGRVWPIVSNTQGGPVHNEKQQIINSFGEPIPRLYAAGELGSAFGYLYLSGANLSECLITGKVAGGEVAQLSELN